MYELTLVQIHLFYIDHHQALDHCRTGAVLFAGNSLYITYSTQTDTVHNKGTMTKQTHTAELTVRLNFCKRMTLTVPGLYCT